MEKNLKFYDNAFEISESYIRLLIIVFVAALFAKGAVLFHGSAIDDYAFAASIDSQDLQVYFSQGRYLSGALVWIINSLGANLSDMYFPLGILSIFLQAAFVVSILRFVGMMNSPAAGVVGAIMVAHPYLTEILSFRMALAPLSVALIFSIIGLEMVTKSPSAWDTRLLSLLAIISMLFTYQVFLNYFAVVIIFAFILGKIFSGKNSHSPSVYNGCRERAITMTIICIISTILFVIVTRLSETLGLTTGEGRTNFISFDEIPKRIDQILTSCTKIYWSSEPIFTGWLKTLVALMLVISIVIILKKLFTEKEKSCSASNILFTFIAFIILAPTSLGVIVPFGNWWPVPRVIAHVSIIIGLTFLLADACMEKSGSYFLSSTISVSRIVVLIGFIFMSNQIFADQRRINQWDKMMANRILSRLEILPNFNDVKFVHISGGTYAFPAELRTIQGDMNISAFAPSYSKVPLLTEGSGYRFEKAIGSKSVDGDTYCAERKPWPHVESIAIDNDLAIICLKK